MHIPELTEHVATLCMCATRQLLAYVWKMIVLIRRWDAEAHESLSRLEGTTGWRTRGDIL